MHDQRTSQLRKGAARLPAAPNYSAARTVAALEQLALRPHSVPELADALNVATRTSRRILQRLDIEGYVVQERGNRRRRYHLTLRLLAVAAAAEANLSALADANTRLDALAQATTATVLVWVPRGGTVVPIWGESTVTSNVMGRLPLGAEAALQVLDGEPAASVTVDDTTVAAVAVTERQRAVAAITMTGAASDADRTALRIAAGDLSV